MKNSRQCSMRRASLYWPSQFLQLHNLIALFQNPEDTQKESCFWERDFIDFPASYIALGHWHNPDRTANHFKPDKDGVSGSPYPIAKGENGPRKAFLIDVDNNVITVEPVDIPGVPYREAISFFFVPGSEELVLEEIGTYLQAKADPNIIIDLDAGGFLETIGERELQSEIQLLIAKHRGGWKMSPGRPALS